MDEHIQDNILGINRRSRKSAEKEYSNIQLKARENPQETRASHTSRRIPGNVTSKGLPH